MPRGRARCDDVRDQALGGAATNRYSVSAQEGWVLITLDRDLSQVLPRIPLAIALAIPLAVAGIHVEVGRRCRAGLAVLLPVALRIHDAEIMLGVLIEVFRRDAVAARLRLPRHRDIALEHLIRVAAYLDARPVALKALGAVRRAWSSATAATATVVMRHAAAVAAA